jgi:dolichol-phosphate mannosyltransferase
MSEVAARENVKLKEFPPQRALVFTATYNERDNIEELVRRVLALPMACDLLVVDDNSPDGTGTLLDELARAEPRLKVVHRPYKLGLGSAHMLAMAWAVRRGYDALVTMDADFSHDPAAIPQLLQALGQADFAIGSRYMKGGSCDYVGRRRAMSLWANRLAWLLLGAGLREYTTSFRAFRVSMLREAQFSRIHSQGYSFFMETVWHLHRAGYRCVETPIRFVDRVHGDSKIPKNEIWNGVLKLGELCVKRLLGWRRPRRPDGPPPSTRG